MAFQLRQEYLISYDIHDTKLRTQVFEELGKYGLKNVQKSVFWGYLTVAELEAVKRFLEEKLRSEDKSFITHSSFNTRGQSHFVGHAKGDFLDWEEVSVI